MKLRELTEVMTREQNVMVIPNVGEAGFYRYRAKDIPPIFLNAEVRNVSTHGAEVTAMVVVG